MPGIRSFGAGAKLIRASGGGGANTAGPQGGGDALQGLPPMANFLGGRAARRYMRTRADGRNRHKVICNNQLGGVGHKWGQNAGPGNRAGVSANCGKTQPKPVEANVPVDVSANKPVTHNMHRFKDHVWIWHENKMRWTIHVVDGSTFRANDHHHKKIRDNTFVLADTASDLFHMVDVLGHESKTVDLNTAIADAVQVHGNDSTSAVQQKRQKLFSGSTEPSRKNDEEGDTIPEDNVEARLGEHTLFETEVLYSQAEAELSFPEEFDSSKTPTEIANFMLEDAAMHNSSSFRYIVNLKTATAIWDSYSQRVGQVGGSVSPIEFLATMAHIAGTGGNTLSNASPLMVSNWLKWCRLVQPKRESPPSFESDKPPGALWGSWESVFEEAGTLSPEFAAYSDYNYAGLKNLPSMCPTDDSGSSSLQQVYDHRPYRRGSKIHNPIGGPTCDGSYCDVNPGQYPAPWVNKYVSGLPSPCIMKGLYTNDDSVSLAPINVSAEALEKKKVSLTLGTGHLAFAIASRASLVACEECELALMGLSAFELGIKAFLGEPMEPRDAPWFTELCGIKFQNEEEREDPYNPTAPNLYINMSLVMQDYLRAVHLQGGQHYIWSVCSTDESASGSDGSEIWNPPQCKAAFQPGVDYLQNLHRHSHSVTMGCYDSENRVWHGGVHAFDGAGRADVDLRTISRYYTGCVMPLHATKIEKQCLNQSDLAYSLDPFNGIFGNGAMARKAGETCKDVPDKPTPPSTTARSENKENQAGILAKACQDASGNHSHPSSKTCKSGVYGAVAARTSGQPCASPNTYLGYDPYQTLHTNTSPNGYTLPTTSPCDRDEMPSYFGQACARSSQYTLDYCWIDQNIRHSSSISYAVAKRPLQRTGLASTDEPCSIAGQRLLYPSGPDAGQIDPNFVPTQAGRVCPFYAPFPAKAYSNASGLSWNDSARTNAVFGDNPSSDLTANTIVCSSTPWQSVLGGLKAHSNKTFREDVTLSTYDWAGADDCGERCQNNSICRAFVKKDGMCILMGDDQVLIDSPGSIAYTSTYKGSNVTTTVLDGSAGAENVRDGLDENTPSIAGKLELTNPLLSDSSRCTYGGTDMPKVIVTLTDSEGVYDNSAIDYNPFASREPYRNFLARDMYTAFVEKVKNHCIPETCRKWNNAEFLRPEEIFTSASEKCSQWNDASYASDEEIKRENNKLCKDWAEASPATATPAPVDGAFVLDECNTSQGTTGPNRMFKTCEGLLQCGLEQGGETACTNMGLDTQFQNCTEFAPLGLCNINCGVPGLARRVASYSDVIEGCAKTPYTGKTESCGFTDATWRGLCLDDTTAANVYKNCDGLYQCSTDGLTLTASYSDLTAECAPVIPGMDLTGCSGFVASTRTYPIQDRNATGGLTCISCYTDELSELELSYTGCTAATVGKMYKNCAGLWRCDNKSGTFGLTLITSYDEVLAGPPSTGASVTATQSFSTCSSSSAGCSAFGATQREGNCAYSFGTYSAPGSCGADGGPDCVQCGNRTVSSPGLFTAEGITATVNCKIEHSTDSQMHGICVADAAQAYNTYLPDPESPGGDDPDVGLQCTEFAPMPDICVAWNRALWYPQTERNGKWEVAYLYDNVCMGRDGNKMPDGWYKEANSRGLWHCRDGVETEQHALPPYGWDESHAINSESAGSSLDFSTEGCIVPRENNAWSAPYTYQKIAQNHPTSVIGQCWTYLAGYVNQGVRVHGGGDGPRSSTGGYTVASGTQGAVWGRADSDPVFSADRVHWVGNRRGLDPRTVYMPVCSHRGDNGICYLNGVEPERTPNKGNNYNMDPQTCKVNIGTQMQDYIEGHVVKGDFSAGVGALFCPTTLNNLDTTYVSMLMLNDRYEDLDHLDPNYSISAYCGKQTLDPVLHNWNAAIWGAPRGPVTKITVNKEPCMMVTTDPEGKKQFSPGDYWYDKFHGCAGAGDYFKHGKYGFYSDRLGMAPGMNTRAWTDSGEPTGKRIDTSTQAGRDAVARYKTQGYAEFSYTKNWHACLAQKRDPGFPDPYCFQDMGPGFLNDAGQCVPSDQLGSTEAWSICRFQCQRSGYAHVGRASIDLKGYGPTTASTSYVDSVTCECYNTQSLIGGRCDKSWRLGQESAWNAVDGTYYKDANGLFSCRWGEGGDGDRGTVGFHTTMPPVGYDGGDPLTYTSRERAGASESDSVLARGLAVGALRYNVHPNVPTAYGRRDYDPVWAPHCSVNYPYKSDWRERKGFVWGILAGTSIGLITNGSFGAINKVGDIIPTVVEGHEDKTQFGTTNPYYGSCIYKYKPPGDPCVGQDCLLGYTKRNDKEDYTQYEYFTGSNDDNCPKLCSGETGTGGAVGGAWNGGFWPWSNSPRNDNVHIHSNSPQAFSNAADTVISRTGADERRVREGVIGGGTYTGVSTIASGYKVGAAQCDLTLIPLERWNGCRAGGPAERVCGCDLPCCGKDFTWSKQRGSEGEIEFRRAGYNGCGKVVEKKEGEECDVGENEMLVYEDDDKCYIASSLQTLWTALLEPGEEVKTLGQPRVQSTDGSGTLSSTEAIATCNKTAEGTYTLPEPTDYECTEDDYKAMGFTCIKFESNPGCLASILEAFGDGGSANAEQVAKKYPRCVANAADSAAAVINKYAQPALLADWIAVRQRCFKEYCLPNAYVEDYAKEPACQYNGGTWCIGTDDNIKAKARADPDGYEAGMAKVIKCSAGRGLGYIPEINNFTVSYNTWTNADRLELPIDSPVTSIPEGGKLHGTWNGPIFKEGSFFQDKFEL